MATLNNMHNKLPDIQIEHKTTVDYSGSADFHFNPTQGTETLTVSYRGENKVVMRALIGEFEAWDVGEKMELIALLSKFCVNSLEERHGNRKKLSVL